MKLLWISLVLLLASCAGPQDEGIKVEGIYVDQGIEKVTSDTNLFEWEETK